MPEASLLFLVLAIAAALIFSWVNGMTDAANAVAASIGSRSISPRNAIILAAFCNMAGAVTGTAVAITIGKGIIDPEAITDLTMIAGLTAASVWSMLAWRYGIPTSETHGIVAAFLGAGIATAGSEAIVWNVMQRVGASVVIAPVLGFTGGFIIMVILLHMFQRSAPARVRGIFTRMQWLTTAFLAYSHGKNDGQMPIGVITMALVVYYGDPGLWDQLPYGDLWWVVVISALAISSGTFVGGWRIIKTLGMKVTSLQPVNGFAADLASASVIEIASELGIPVSTTHCAVSSVMGVGATKRLTAVRWGVAGNIVTAWILTFPICGGLGYLFAWLLEAIF